MASAPCALAARLDRCRGRLTAVAGLAAALSSCTVGPAYHRPSTQAPAAWHTTVEQAPAAWPSVDWWRGFGSPQLDQLIGEARRANDDLAAAVARVHEAEAQVTIASAPLVPTLDGGMTATRQRMFIPQNGGSSLTFNTLNPALSASYQLDFWGKNWAARKAALALADSSRYDRQTVELTVMTNVANDFFTVLELNEQVQIAQNNLGSAEQTLKGLEIDASVGTTTSLDVAQQAAEVATLSASIPPLQQQLRQTLDALAILIGKTPQDFDLSSGTLASIMQPQPSAGLPSGLLARRPDVAEAEAQLIAANADIAQARAAFFPDIALTASGGFASTALSTVLNSANTVFSLAAALTQPIFQGGALEGQAAFTRARYEELLAGYHKTVLGALGNVEDSLVGLRQTGEQERRQKQAVATARRAYEIAQARLRAGTINVLALLNTESALFAAQDALAQVELSHMQALVGLFNALGGGWREPAEP